YAGQCNRLWDLELLCRTKSLEAAFLNQDKPVYNKKLFLNVNPNVMHDIKFRQGFTKEYLSQYGITPENIIFEITERNAVNDMSSFKNTVIHYKEQTYKIAIDDAGAGYSGLNLISDIKPHYIKLDMNLIRNIDTDNIKFALVKSMIELSRMSNIHLVAEGIETQEELSTLINLGVQYGQGYFIQKPKEEMDSISPTVLNILKDINQKKNHTFGNQVNNIYIENLTTNTNTIAPTTSVEQVFEIFKSDPSILSLCIVKNNIVLGTISKARFTLQLSGRYGFSLYQNKSITALMETDFLEVDFDTPISAVSHIAMSRPANKLYDFIIVTKNGEYLGTVTIKDLLQKTTEIEVVTAKHQNPLSGLPGNIIIEQRINKCITSDAKYSILYLDIDNFKAYNDVYGFENGDMIIKLLASTMAKNISNSQFIGHIGGDDFVIILDNYEVESICEAIIGDFEHDVLNYYNENDIKNGFIVTQNRHGVTEQFPLISLSIVAITNKYKKLTDQYQISEQLASLKKQCKQHKGNCHYLV
ncbi:MAG: EAL domain-containing protein, partial [Ruminiclostridium sp.]